MKFSASFKVGLLTVISIIILVFSIMWIKGRALSSGERITVSFKDINGIRAGSGVQMMGYRIGQVEELIPVIKGSESYVDVKFVIIEPKITIPDASEISIQQSGLIGEQFLEITPPRIRNIYLSFNQQYNDLHEGDSVKININGKNHKIGVVKDISVVPTESVPIFRKENISTKNSYKISYIITMPGLILPTKMQGHIEKDNLNVSFLKLKTDGNIKIVLPDKKTKYTIIEPIRLADFMDLQYKSAEALTETNKRISAILTDDIIKDLQQTAVNLEEVTSQAKTTLEKAELLIDTSQKEITSTLNSINYLTKRIVTLTDNINSVLGDEKFKANVENTLLQVGKLSSNMNVIFEDPKTKETLDNMNAIARNINDISAFVNDMSKDPNLKTKVTHTVDNFNGALIQLETTLKTLNSVTGEDTQKIKKMISDTADTAENAKKFSDKLNKHFLLFRLIF